MLQDEPRNPDEDAREDPTTETPEEGSMSEENLNLISVINNNSVIVSTVPYDQFVAHRYQKREWI